MKKIIAFILFLSALSSSAFALNGYYSRGRTCADLQRIVQRDGEITILHRIGNMTFYANQSRCDQFPWSADHVRGYEPSSDQSRCFVGWECIFHDI